MPKIITNGRLIKDVKDSHHTFGEAKTHHYMWVRDTDTGEEYPIGFTDKSLAAARRIATRNAGDVPQKHWIIDAID